MITLNVVRLDVWREKGEIDMSWWSGFFQLESKNKRSKGVRSSSSTVRIDAVQDHKVAEHYARETQLQNQRQDLADQNRLDRELKQDQLRLDEERRIAEEQRSRKES